MKHLGDYDAGGVIYGKFTSYAVGGAPATLAGGTLAVYADSSTTEDTSAITLTTDFDSRTGFNHYAIDTSIAPSFYTAGRHFAVVIVAGNIGGTVVAGSVVAEFTLRRNSALKPTTAGVTLNVSSGRADADIKAVNAITVNGAGTAGSPWGP